jgi:hypothetical protein
VTAPPLSRGAFDDRVRSHLRGWGFRDVLSVHEVAMCRATWQARLDPFVATRKVVESRIRMWRLQNRPPPDD